MKQYPAFMVNIVRLAISPNRSSDLTQSPSIPAGSFAETDKLILKFMYKFKKPKIVKTTLQKENKGGRIHTSHLKNYIKLQ